MTGSQSRGTKQVYRSAGKTAMRIVTEDGGKGLTCHSSVQTGFPSRVPFGDAVWLACIVCDTPLLRAMQLPDKRQETARQTPGNMQANAAARKPFSVRGQGTGIRGQTYSLPNSCWGTQFGETLFREPHHRGRPGDQVRFFSLFTEFSLAISALCEIISPTYLDPRPAAEW